MKEINYDIAVIGLGATGSATTYQLAKQGVNVLGIDSFSPPHIHGSTHGDTRITRLAIGEGPEYVPLVLRSNELWREIEQKVGYELLNQCGGLIMAVPNGHGNHGVSDFLARTIESAQSYGIGHETLTTKQIEPLFPQFNLTGGETGYFEPEAGFLRPEACVKAQLDLASKLGATLRPNEQVLSYVSTGSYIEIKTNRRVYTTEKIIVAAGPWIKDLFPEFASSFKIYRQVPYWFNIEDESQYDVYKDAPIVLWEFGNEPEDTMAVFPAIDGLKGGVKVFKEDFSAETTADESKRSVSEGEISQAYDECVRDKLRGLGRKCIKAAPCLYTVSSDHAFVIDFHPKHKNVIIASPCSGHGFKHSAAVGEVLSQLAVKGRSDLDINKFRISRFDD